MTQAVTAGRSLAESLWLPHGGLSSQAQHETVVSWPWGRSMTPAVIRKICVVTDWASQRLAYPRLVMKLLTFSNIQDILNRGKTAVKAQNCRDLDIFVLDFSAFLCIYLVAITVTPSNKWRTLWSLSSCAYFFVFWDECMYFNLDVLFAWATCASTGSSYLGNNALLLWGNLWTLGT